MLISSTNRSRTTYDSDHDGPMQHEPIFNKGQTPESGIPPNIAPKVVTPKIHLPIWVSSGTLIGRLATVTIFGSLLGGISHFGFSV